MEEVMEEKEFETREAVERLKDIGKWMPELRDQFTTGFCAFVGRRIGEGPIYPTGYILAFTLALADAKCGTDGFTGKPVPRELSGQHPMVYNLVWKMKVFVARATFGDEFADLVDAQVKILEA